VKCSDKKLKLGENTYHSKHLDNNTFSKQKDMQKKLLKESKVEEVHACSENVTKNLRMMHPEGALCKIITKMGDTLTHC
jgi:hypothetical protein